MVRPYSKINRLREEAEEEGRTFDFDGYIVGCRLRFLCGAPDVLVYPEDREG